tara:strand:+ start:15139 stop:16152 length:1014 start_codon:yes stop_codon:yes gene_type:complete
LGKVKVVINGYGVIGRRVADAILKQDDMELIGVTKTKPDFRLLEAKEKRIKIFTVSDKNAFEEKNYQVEGDLKDALKETDVVIDCSPKNKGVENLEVYKQFPNLKVIFQGGESHNLTNFSFNSQCNYDEAKEKKYARVVSCNTTALCRIISQLNKFYKIKKARVAVVRRSADPGNSKKSIINSWEPKLEYPSHHSPDVTTVIPDIKISSLAGIAPMTAMHGHMLFIEFYNQPNTPEEVIKNLECNPRIKIISSEEGFSTTAQIKDFSVSNGRKGNMYEVCIWKEGIGLDEDSELGMHIAIDQQAIVVPETIDAIRAMFGLMEKDESINKTNANLNIS